MDYPKPINNIDDLPKRYGGIERERFWQQYWRAAGIYDYDPTRPREEVYSVDTPPPTVSGKLHIGHVFSYTQTDFSVRYQRMRGKHIFYPFGFDDNGLPSERLVENITGKRAHEVGREEFIKLCEPIIKDAEQEFIDLWQSLALSCDWTQFYTTINERSRAISQASFIDLFGKGYIYRKEAPTQWCWADQTAIAQAEIEDREVAGHFHDITFQFDDGSGKLQPVTIATTRPELVPACVAVFAHPDDERYRHLFGKKAITPLFNVEVPILPSEKADPEKGTGILMCCTFGDQEDVEHWEQFNLPTRVVIGRDGKLIDITTRFIPAAELDCSFDGNRYHDGVRHQLATKYPTRNRGQARKLAAELAGLKTKQARKWIREQLEAAGLLTKVEDITHIVRHSERGGVPIEIIVTPQWYISILKHKDELIAQGLKVKWHPEYMRKRYEHWVEGLNQDWCISRQRYNGVPFPVWFEALEETEEIILADPQQLPVNPLVDKPAGYENYQLYRPQTNENDESTIVSSEPDTGDDSRPMLIAESDVMDTWATSSVTPLLNTHLRLGQDDPEAQARHDRLFPFDLRPQAHDIIRTWAFYTIAKAYFHFGELPWRDIVISGHAQDARGKKISKSKGHVVTPAEMVEKYTADGLRYWSSGCKLGTDTIYDEKSLTDGKKLINKIFNATKFALRHLLEFDPVAASGGATAAANPGSGAQPGYSIDALLKLVTYPTDQWMLEKLRQTIERATRANDAYEFGDARQAAEEFFWGDFCDNYLEMSKGRLYSDAAVAAAHPGADPAELRLSAQTALFLALSAVLKLFAPALPHVAEECWSWYHARFTTGQSIHAEPWPPADKQAAGDAALTQGKLLADLVALVRKWKSEHNVSLKKAASVMRVYAGDAAEATLELAAGVRGDLLATCGAAELDVAAGSGPDDAVGIEGLSYRVALELAPEEAE